MYRFLPDPSTYETEVKVMLDFHSLSGKNKITHSEKVLRQIENPLGVTDLEVRILTICINSFEFVTQLELYGHFNFDNKVYLACESLYRKKLASPRRHPLHGVTCCCPTEEGITYYNLLRMRFEEHERNNKILIGKFIIGACTTVAALATIIEFIISHR